jgi:hypothetical protein
MSDIFVAHLERAFVLAQQNQSKILPLLSQMDGLSGVKTRHFYNNLCGINGVRNLQISSWSPSIVCSALCGNNQTLTALTCITNFKNCDVRFKMEFETQFNKFRANSNSNFIDTVDYLNLDTSSFGKYNIYVYDGDHAIDSHVSALTHFYPILDDIFIYVVEHWNWESVRMGTFKAINDLKLNVVWGRDIRLTMDNTHTPIKMAKDTWWNGIGAFVLQKTSAPSSSVIPVVEIAPSSELDSLLDSIVNDVTTETVENIDNTLLDEPEEISVEPAPTPTLTLTPTPTTEPKNKKKKKATK